jgi:transcriptional regulator with XRE-family HTH domain
MNQPELGKKIAELRKLKGLTQDELVDMCNLSIRTLQRIESGEVTPRSFTVKTIFTALDYNIYEITQSDKKGTPDELKSKFLWLEQIIKYVFDLFNLKTKTMKKLLILSSLTILMVFLFTGLTTAQSVDKSTLVGTWQLCDSSGKLVTTGNVRVKVITTESFTVAGIDRDKKIFSAIFIGSYSLKNSVYSETITYAATQMLSFVGQTNNFNIELKGDLLYLKGLGNSYNEIWQRISK